MEHMSDKELIILAEAVIAAVAEFPYVVTVAGPGSLADEKLGVRVRRLVRQRPKVST